MHRGTHLIAILLTASVALLSGCGVTVVSRSSGGGLGPDPVLTGACCLFNGNCIVVTESDCVLQLGVYQGDSSGCTPFACPES